MRARFFLLAFFLFSHFSVADDFVQYEVKEGDWLAKILRSIGLCPLWGPDGYVSMLNQENGEVVRRKGDLINTGKILLLPKKLIAQGDHFHVKDNRLQISEYHPRAEGCRKVEFADLLAEPEEAEVERAPAALDEEPLEIEIGTGDIEAVSPPPPPSPPLSPKKEEPWERSFFLSVAPISDWSRIVGTDLSEGGKSTLLSKVNYGLSTSLSYGLGRNSRLGIVHEMSIRKSTWQISSDRSLSSSGQVLPSFATGVTFKVFNRFQLLAGASVAKEIFYRPLTFPSIEMDSLYVPAFFSGVQWNFLSRQWFRSFVYYRYSFLFNANDSNYSLANGNRHHFVVGSNFRFLKQIWGAGLRAALANQESAIISKEELTTGVRVYWVHRF